MHSFCTRYVFSSSDSLLTKRHQDCDEQPSMTPTRVRRRMTKKNAGNQVTSQIEVGYAEVLNQSYP